MSRVNSFPPVVDVHTHVFNARHLPLKGIFLSFIEDPGWLTRKLAGAMARLIEPPNTPPAYWLVAFLAHGALPTERERRPKPYRRSRQPDATTSRLLRAMNQIYRTTSVWSPRGDRGKYGIGC